MPARKDAARSCGRTGLSCRNTDGRGGVDLTQLSQRALQHARADDQHDLPASREGRGIRPEEFPRQTFGSVTVHGQRQVLLGGDDGEPGRTRGTRRPEVQKKRPAIESRAFLAEAAELGRGANSTLPRETHGGLGSAEALAADGTALGQNLTATGGLGTGAETALAGAGDLRRTVGRMHGFKGDSQGDGPKGVKPHASRLAGAGRRGRIA